MGRAKKVLFYGFGFIILVVAAAAVFLKVYFTKERVMALVIPPLEKKLSRKVALSDAGAGLSGFYITGLDIKGDQDPLPLLKVEKVSLGWDFTALLKFKVALGQVALIGPEIALFKDEKGRLNIQDLIGPEKEPKKAEPPKPEPEAKKAAPLAITIKRVVLKRGMFTFRDATKSPARVYKVADIDFEASGFSLTEPFPYTLGAQVTVGRPFDLKVEGTLDPVSRDVKALVRVEGVELGPTLEALSGTAGPVAQGKFGVTLDISIAGTKNLALAAEAEIESLKLDTGSGLTEPINLNLGLKTAFVLPPKTIGLERLSLAVNGQEITGRGTFEIGNSPHRVDLSLGSKSLNIDEILSVFPKDKKAEEQAGGQTAEKPGKKEPAKKSVIKPLPVRGKVSLNIAWLKVKNIEVEPINALIWLKDKGIYVEPLYGGLYDGKFKGKAEALYDIPGPPFTGQIELEGTAVGRLVKAVQPDFKGNLSGTMAATADAKGEGGDLARLNSRLKVVVKDGRLDNHVAVEKMARLFRTDELKEILFDSLIAEGSTAFGVATVKSLTMTGPHLRLAGHAAIGLLDKKLSGRLTVKVPKRWANNIIPIETVLDEISEEPGWPALPVLVSGTTADPSFSVDPKWLAQKTVGLVERGVKDVIKGSENGVKDIQKGLEKGIKKGLKGIKDNLPFLR